MTTRMTPWRRTGKRCEISDCSGLEIERTIRHYPLQGGHPYQTIIETGCSVPDCYVNMTN